MAAVVAWLRCWGQLRHAKAVVSPELDHLVARLSQRLNVRRHVRLLVTSRPLGPAVLGVLSPTIVLPEIVVRGRQPREIEPILAHELIHVRRGDLWIALLQVGAQSIWWFHPLVWCANRLCSREAERCCDEQVIGELGCDPQRYARSLLEILELKSSLRAVPAVPGMKPVEVTSQRLERIMKLGQGCHTRTPHWCWMVLLLLSVAVLPGAAFLGADDREETATEVVEAQTPPSQQPAEASPVRGGDVPRKNRMSPSTFPDCDSLRRENTASTRTICLGSSSRGSWEN